MAWNDEAPTAARDGAGGGPPLGGLEEKILESPTAPVLIVQFFLVPMLIVLTCVALYVGVRWMTGEEHGVVGLIDEVRNARDQRKWQAAFELSRKLALDRQANVPIAREVNDKLLDAFRESRKEDPQIRRFLVLAVGNLKDARAVDLLIGALTDADSAVRIGALLALGNIGDARGVPAVERLATDPDPGIRKAVYYTLGLYGARSSRSTLVAGTQDAQDDVRWNAALALARMKDPGGSPVLLEMLDRARLARVQGRDEEGHVSPLRADNIEDVMINAITGVVAVDGREFVPVLEGLARADASLKVRRAALAALETLRPPKQE